MLSVLSMSETVSGTHLFVYTNSRRSLSVVWFRKVRLLTDEGDGAAQSEGGLFAQELVMSSQVCLSRRPVAFDLVLGNDGIVGEERAAHLLCIWYLSFEDPFIISVLGGTVPIVAMDNSFVRQTIHSDGSDSS